jgi:hypothetical protein
MSDEVCARTHQFFFRIYAEPNPQLGVSFTNAPF